MVFYAGEEEFFVEPEIKGLLFGGENIATGSTPEIPTGIKFINVWSKQKLININSAHDLEDFPVLIKLPIGLSNVLFLNNEDNTVCLHEEREPGFYFVRTNLNENKKLKVWYS